MTKYRTGYLFKRGSIFYLEYKINGKRVKHALKDKEGNSISALKEARRRREEIMAPLKLANQEESLQLITQRLDVISAEGRAIKESGPQPLQIDDSWATYEKATNRPDSGEATMEQYHFQFNRFARWVKTEHPRVVFLKDVTPSIASEYATHLLNSNLSPNTYNKHIRLLELLFRVLEDKARIIKNPWTNISRKKTRPQGRRELTVEELHKLCAAAQGEMKTLFAIGLYTGLRRGDCCTLRWAEVDLHRGLIIRIPNKTARGKATPVTIPLHPVLTSILKETASNRCGEYVLPEMAEHYRNARDKVTDSIQKHFENCAIRTHKEGTGIYKDQDGSVIKSGKRAVVEVGFHSLRHSFVSICREAGAPLAVVEAIVGHSNPAMTRHYTHVGELAARKAIAALPSFTDKNAPVSTKPQYKSDQTMKIIKALTQMNHKNWKKVKDKLLADLA